MRKIRVSDTNGSRYVRTTISLPAEVKAAMVAVGEQVNWSAVATAAFKAKIQELEEAQREEERRKILARFEAELRSLPR